MTFSHWWKKMLVHAVVFGSFAAAVKWLPYHLGVLGMLLMLATLICGFLALADTIDLLTRGRLRRGYQPTLVYIDARSIVFKDDAPHWADIDGSRQWERQQGAQIELRG